MRGHRFFILAGLLGACGRSGSERPLAADPVLSDAARAEGTGPIQFGPERIPPQGSVALGEVERSNGVVSNVDRVVMGMRAGIRVCYMRGLVNAPDQRGGFRVRVAVGARGEVTRADVEGAKGISAETVDCVVRRVQSASFAQPDDGAATFSFSVTLEPARSE